MDPINIQGLHNLCVVYVERGKLAQAQSCLSYAHQLAPHEDYIVRHLQIVQTRINRLKMTPGPSREKDIAFADFDPKDFGGSSEFLLVNANSVNSNSNKSPQSSSSSSKPTMSKDDPVFIESEAMSSTIDQDYRTSNSNSNLNNEQLDQSSSKFRHYSNSNNELENNSSPGMS